MDGSESTDPDVDPDKDSGLRYEWYCRRKVERRNEQLDLKSKSGIKKIPNIYYPKEKLWDMLSDNSGI